MPGRHARHTEAVVLDAYVPALHVVHEPAGLTEYAPVPQLVHPAEPAEEYCPLEHAEHVAMDVASVAVL